jgi:hypothetical protein
MGANVVEQGGLPGTGESGQYGDGQAIGHDAGCNCNKVATVSETPP